MTKSKSKKFLVTTRIIIVQDAEVTADTFEEAVEKSKKINLRDMISWEGTANCYSLKVVGISLPDSWDTEQ